MSTLFLESAVLAQRKRKRKKIIAHILKNTFQGQRSGKPNIYFIMLPVPPVSFHTKL